jgi:hypothetical protein
MISSQRAMTRSAYDVRRIFQFGFQDGKSALRLKAPPQNGGPYAAGWAAARQNEDFQRALDVYLRSRSSKFNN